ncbi:tyrosine-type recombinase/integrase [Thermodesulfobacteriota bacterium]
MPEPMRMFQRENGIYYAEFKRGKKRSLKTRNKDTAKEIYRELKREYLRGRLVLLDAGKKITLAEFKTFFLENHADISDDTRRGYELALRLLADSLGGSTLLSRVPKMFKKFISDCRARGVSTISINTYLTNIRTPLNKAYEWELLKKKPAVKLLKTGKKLPRVLTMKEIVAILRWARRNDYEMYRIILFALWTGARRSEILNARWENYNDGSIKLLGKGNKERTVPLLPMAQFAAGVQKNIGRIFRNPRSADTISHRFKNICRSTDVIKAHFHNLRHTAATYFLAAGIDITMVQKILGHAALSTTQIYADVLQERLKAEMWGKLAPKMHPGKAK